MLIQHVSQEITISVVVQQSSSTVDKSFTQETKEEAWFITESGEKILVVLDTIYF
jgi:hypothetical protein